MILKNKFFKRKFKINLNLKLIQDIKIDFINYKKGYG